MKEGKSGGLSHWLDEGGKRKRKAQDYPAILSLNSNSDGYGFSNMENMKYREG